MNSNSKEKDIIQDTILESRVPFHGSTFSQLITNVSSKEAIRIISETQKYQKYIENPQDAGFFTEKILKDKRGSRTDYLINLKEEITNAGHNIDPSDISSLSHDEKSEIARASVRLDLKYKNSISPAEILQFIHKNIFDSRYKFYLNCLWQRNI